MTDVHPKRIALFNHAADAARRQDHEAALSLYRSAASTDKEARGRPASGEFVATALIRAGFCLMDLQRYDEALAELERAMRLERELSTEGQYELYFAYGNTLGRLGRLDDSFRALIEAIGRAEDLDDYTMRPTRCWCAVLEHGERARAWRFVHDKALIAIEAARVRNNAALVRLAERSAVSAAEHIGGVRAS